MIKNKYQITIYFAPNWQSAHLACKPNKQERIDLLGSKVT